MCTGNVKVTEQRSNLLGLQVTVAILKSTYRAYAM